MRERVRGRVVKIKLHDALLPGVRSMSFLTSPRHITKLAVGVAGPEDAPKGLDVVPSATESKH